MSEHAGLSVMDQYAKRKFDARQSWAWHMLLVAAAFAGWVWGPHRLALLFGLTFAVAFFHGIYRQTRIDRCPACDGPRISLRVVIAGRMISPGNQGLDPHCERCGVQLLPE